MKGQPRRIREYVDTFDWHPGFAWFPCRVGTTEDGLGHGQPYQWLWLEPIEKKTCKYVDVFWTNRRLPLYAGENTAFNSWFEQEYRSLMNAKKEFADFLVRSLRKEQEKIFRQFRKERNRNAS